jgi:hypothetical protein
MLFEKAVEFSRIPLDEHPTTHPQLGECSRQTRGENGFRVFFGVCDACALNLGNAACVVSVMAIKRATRQRMRL